MPATSPASSRKTSKSPSRAAPATAAKRTAKAATKAPAKQLPGKAAKSSKPAAARKPAARKSAKASTPASASGAKTKQKLVRDSFTMPQSDFALIEQLKTRALAMLRPAKKSELLRAGLQMLSASSDAALRAVLEALTPLKAGRPRKSV